MSLKYTPDTFYCVLAFNRRQFENWRLEHNISREKCSLMESVMAMQGWSFTNPLKELIGLVSWADNKDRAFLDEAARLQARYCLDRGVHKIPMEMTIV